jgi:hypothetical protein
MWSLGIIRSDNGYILKWYEENEDGQQMPHTLVVEESDEEGGELEAMRNMLCRVKEHFGVFYSKHNKFNLDISIHKNKEFGQ